MHNYAFYDALNFSAEIYHKQVKERPRDKKEATERILNNNGERNDRNKRKKVNRKAERELGEEIDEVERHNPVPADANVQNNENGRLSGQQQRYGQRTFNGKRNNRFRARTFARKK